MNAEYYAEISLDTNSYFNIVCITETNSYKMTGKSKRWIVSKRSHEAPWETCYDDISKDEAEKLAQSWGVDKETFCQLPADDKKPFRMSLYIGEIPEYSLEHWHVPYFDAELALNNKKFCGDIMSDKLNLIDEKLHDKYCIDSGSDCWRGNMQEIKQLFESLGIVNAEDDLLQDDIEYGIQYFASFIEEDKV